LSETEVELEIGRFFRARYVRKHEIDPKDYFPCIAKREKRNGEVWIVHLDNKGNLKQWPLGEWVRGKEE
jgi:hypothetical protein